MRLEPAGKQQDALPPSRASRGKLALSGCEEGGGDRYLVGVPQADGAAQRQLPHEQVVHPAEGKLQVLHLVPPEVTVHLL